MGPDWLEYVMVNLTALGSTPVLLLVTLLAAGLMLVQRKRKEAALLSVAVLLGELLTNGLKLFFLRDRPDLVAHLVEVRSASFPSGHAMNSAIVYLTIAGLLARAQLDRSLRIYLLAAGTLLTALVGLSRVYLGVHWPTDVLAGWFIGAAWAALCVLAARRFDPASSGHVERQCAASTDGALAGPATGG